MLVALALGIALTLLVAARPVAADGPFGFLVPIVLEEFRTPPDIIADDLPSVRDVQAQQTSTKLIGNTGQANASPATFGAANDRTVPFTTGSNSLGYKVTSVDFQFGVAGTTSHFTVKIRKEHTAGSADRPADGSNNLVGTLSRTAALTVGNNTFTAAGAGLDLDANTTYFLILDSVSSPTPEASATTSSNWDSGEAAGWSIVNKMVFRSPSSAVGMGNSHLDTSGRKLKLAINGHAKTPPPATPPPTIPPPVFKSGDDGRSVGPGPWISPRPNRVDLTGTNVVVSMDKAVVLDDTNYTTAQLAAKFTIWVNGDRVDAVGASLSGYQVRLDLGSSFSAPAGARVAVNYAPGPLLDAAVPENRVGGFSLSPGPWTSPRPNRVDATATGVVASMDRPVQLDSNYSASQLAWAFTVRVNGTAYTPTGASVSGRDIHLNIGHPVADGDKLDVDYTRGPLQDSTGMRVGGFNYAGFGR